MKANRVSTPSPLQLQELFDLPSGISEADILEYLDAERKLFRAQGLVRQAREEFELCRHNLSEMLVLGLQVDSKRFSVEIKDGRILVKP